MTQTNPLAVARSYIDLWNEADDAGRKARLAESWAVGARYVDPIMSGEGHDSLAAMIAGARSFPGQQLQPARHAGRARIVRPLLMVACARARGAGGRRYRHCDAGRPGPHRFRDRLSGQRTCMIWIQSHG